MATKTATLSPGVRKLLEGANFAHMATVMRDGSPQVTPVWIDVDGDRLLVNSAEGRTKLRNVGRDPRIAISIADQQNPYQSAFIRGRVVEMRHEGADKHIDKLAKKYLGMDLYPNRREGEQRVILVIQPEEVSTMGLEQE